MKLDGTDIVRAILRYKDHFFNNEAVRVFVDWGESKSGDYVIYGSPFQVVGNGWASLGAHPDSTVHFTEENVGGSFPNVTDVALGSVGPVHFKPGVNI